MSIQRIRCWRSKIISVFAGWTAVLITFKVFQIKLFYALPVDYKHRMVLNSQSHQIYTSVARAISHLGLKAPLVSEGSSSSRTSKSCDLEAPEDESALGRTLVAGRGVNL